MTQAAPNWGQPFSPTQYLRNCDSRPDSDAVAPSANDVVRIEAESLDLDGYQTAWLRGSGASERAFISLGNASGGTGTATGAFNGQAGRYNVKIGYYDERDGQSKVNVTIDGKSADLVFDADLPSNLPTRATKTTAETHKAIELEPGDKIEISGQADQWEFARIDYIDFEPVDAAPDPDPDPDPSPDPDPDPTPDPDPSPDPDPDPTPDPDPSPDPDPDPTPDPDPDPTPDPDPDPTPDPDPSPDPDPGPDFGAFEREVLKLTNEFRQQNGRDPLNLDAKLNEAAESHSRNMAQQDFFSHTGRDGSSAGDRIEDAGYDWRAWAENIAAGQPTPQDVMNGWINSPGHRANLLDANLQDIGIGYVHLANDTGSVNYNHYWTQNFGRPAADQQMVSNALDTGALDTGTADPMSDILLG